MNAMKAFCAGTREGSGSETVLSSYWYAGTFTEGALAHSGGPLQPLLLQHYSPPGVKVALLEEGGVHI